MAETSLKYFTQVLSVISEFGISESECLNAAGLTEIPKSQRVNANHLAKIFNFAATSLNDPQIGMKCGLKFPILQYTRPADFLKLCDNLGHAADIYNRYSPLFHTVGISSGVISENGDDRMIWTPHISQELSKSYPQFIEYIITNFVTSINWLAWKTPNAVQQVNIQHEAILPISQYKDLFDCDVKFGQSEYSFILHDAVKDAPFSTADKAELSRQCIKFDRALNELKSKESLIDSIEHQITLSLEGTLANKTSIAKTLGMNERTLARTLKDNGTSFKEIKNRVLKNLAIAKLNQDLPLSEIAQDLGYNDQPAFTRAFKKWFGYPPGKHNSAER